MIIDVKYTNFKLVIPDGYKKLEAKNILNRFKMNHQGIGVYQKITSNADCIFLFFITDPKEAMDFEDANSLISTIHEDLGENQGLIVVENGVTERGIPFIYSIVKTVGNEQASFGLIYHLRMNLKVGMDIIEIQADFTEIGTTGLRDSLGMSIALKSGLVTKSDTNELLGWQEDPYDSSYTKGNAMNLSEREGLDGLFPDHPLSQAREFVHAIIHDELMIYPDDTEVTKEDSQEDREELSDEEIAKLLFSKDTERRFIPNKIVIEKKDYKEEVKQNLKVMKKKIDSTKEEVVHTASVVGKFAKDKQMAVLTFIHKKKNAHFLEAKLSAFEDGLKEGKVIAVDYVKKYMNFCLASTAISYYFARCDQSISEEEKREIEYDLDSIIKNKDLPDSLKKKLYKISHNTNLCFKDVSQYLDGVGIDTLKEFEKDINEIIMADQVITKEERKAKEEFDTYLAKRLELN